MTYSQFEIFLKKDGYSNDEYWTTEGIKWKQKESITQPKSWNNSQWHIANHPVVEITWFEASAFCAWLSKQLGYKIRLPSEQEWEKAARGTDGRIYAYGNKYDIAKGNTRDSGIGRTSAVGVFPHGASPYGLLDMSSNVWNWCETVFDERIEEEGVWRNLRGGAWFRYEDYARTTSRGSDIESYTSPRGGFRVLRPTDT